MFESEVKVARFDSDHLDDFFVLHNDVNEAGWCFCVAWWVPTWKAWGERTADNNRKVREELLAGGEFDGYLLYVDGRPAGWCQAGPRDRLAKLTEQFQLDPDPDVWALTCFLIAPAFRRMGLAVRMHRGVLADLRSRGVRHVEAYPRRGNQMDPTDLWNGPESMFLAAGYTVVRDDPIRPILAIDLSDMGQNTQ